MPAVAFSDTFISNFDGKSQEMQAKLLRAIKRIGENPRHPGLHAKPIRGTKRLYEARADRANRITWEWQEGGILLRNNCNHDIVTRAP